MMDMGGHSMCLATSTVQQTFMKEFSATTDQPKLQFQPVYSVDKKVEEEIMQNNNLKETQRGMDAWLGESLKLEHMASSNLPSGNAPPNASVSQEIMDNRVGNIDHSSGDQRQPNAMRDVSVAAHAPSNASVSVEAVDNNSTKFTNFNGYQGHTSSIDIHSSVHSSVDQVRSQTTTKGTRHPGSKLDSGDVPQNANVPPGTMGNNSDFTHLTREGFVLLPESTDHSEHTHSSIYSSVDQAMEPGKMVKLLNDCNIDCEPDSSAGELLSWELLEAQFGVGQSTKAAGNRGEYPHLHTKPKARNLDTDDGDARDPSNVHGRNKKKQTKKNQSTTLQQTMKKQSEPVSEYLCHAFQGPHYKPSKFKYTEHIPFWKNFVQSFSGEWDKGFTGNSERANSAKMHLFTSENTENGQNDRSHMLVRVKQTPHPFLFETHHQFVYTVYFNQDVLQQIDPLHQQYFEIATHKKSFELLPAHFILEFFEHVQSNNFYRNAQAIDVKVSELLEKFRDQNTKATREALSASKGSIILQDTRKIERQNRETCDADYVEALTKFMQRFPTSMTIGDNKVVFDHSQFSATVGDVEGVEKLVLSWRITHINDVEANMNDSNHVQITMGQLLGQLGDFLISSFVNTLDTKINALKHRIQQRQAVANKAIEAAPNPPSTWTKQFNHVDQTVQYHHAEQDLTVDTVEDAREADIKMQQQASIQQVHAQVQQRVPVHSSSPKLLRSETGNQIEMSTATPGKNVGRRLWESGSYWKNQSHVQRACQYVWDPNNHATISTFSQRDLMEFLQSARFFTPTAEYNRKLNLVTIERALRRYNDSHMYTYQFGDIWVRSCLQHAQSLQQQQQQHHHHHQQHHQQQQHQQQQHHQHHQQQHHQQQQQQQHQQQQQQQQRQQQVDVANLMDNIEGTSFVNFLPPLGPGELDYLIEEHHASFTGMSTPDLQANLISAVHNSSLTLTTSRFQQAWSVRRRAVGGCDDGVVIAESSRKLVLKLIKAIKSDTFASLFHGFIVDQQSIQGSTVEVTHEHTSDVCYVHELALRVTQVGDVHADLAVEVHREVLKSCNIEGVVQMFYATLSKIIFAHLTEKRNVLVQRYDAEDNILNIDSMDAFTDILNEMRTSKSELRFSFSAIATGDIAGGNEMDIEEDPMLNTPVVKKPERPCRIIQSANDDEIQIDYARDHQSQELIVTEWNVFKEMTDVSKITQLELSAKVSDHDAHELATRLTYCNSLQILKLDEIDLDDQTGDMIATWLASNTALKVLSLGRNKIGDASGVEFGKALATNTSLKDFYLNNNMLGEESGVALVTGLSQNSKLTDLKFFGKDGISPATRAKIKFALSPELKSLLNDPSVSPSRIPVCVVGFDNVGKTELVHTWYRTSSHYIPHLDPEETAEAKCDNDRDKTSGISIKPITLQHSLQSTDESPTSTPTTKRRKLSTTVDIMAWDFAGHGEYYISHELMMSGFRDALFVVLFRIDRLLHPETRNAEMERLFFWLRFMSTMRSNLQQQPPTVFIGGSFRPDSCVFDLNATTEWTDFVLQKAKHVFGGMLNIPQQKVYLMDCRKCYDPHVVALRNALAEAAEATRTREDRKIPPICETARGLLHQAKQDVAAKLDSYEQHLRTCQSNPNASVTPLSWLDTLCCPIMSRADFEEHVLGRLEVKADGINAEEGFVDALFDERELYLAIPTIAPKSTRLFQIITTYLHDVGDILWFDIDGLRDTVILTPDLFCSKIIGAIFRPDAPGFRFDAVHGGGGLVPKSTIVTTFKRALGIDDTHVDAALAIICQLGLGHRHQDGGRESYLFPGALAATSYRRPEWFGPLPPGQHFVVGRRFTLVDPATTIFAPGCMSEIQVWALGRYEGSMIWHDGVVIPYTATQTLAGAGIQLHRPHSSSQDGDRYAQVSMSSVTLVVRGSDAASKEDCLRLLNQLCQRIRETSGAQLVEEALPPNEVAKSSTNNNNMLDVACPGFAITPNLDPAIRGVVVGGKVCTIDSLRFGSFVHIPHPVQSIPVPRLWMGNDFEPVCAQIPNGGAHLLVEIPRDHADFIHVEINMRRSMPNAVICTIQRVQNRALWNKYFLARSDIAKECEDANPNEIEAWHSTGTTDPWLICSDWKAGFDVNRSVIEMHYGYDNTGRQTRAFRNLENKSYGTGVYLTKHAIYPDTILPHIRPMSQDKQIILAKVTLGNNFDYGKVVPDRRSSIEPEGYHSISGTEGDMKFLLGGKQKLVAERRWSPALEELVVNGAVYGRQYVVHRSNQVYPAYLVTYK